MSLPLDGGGEVGVNASPAAPACLMRNDPRDRDLPTDHEAQPLIQGDSAAVREFAADRQMSVRAVQRRSDRVGEEMVRQ